MSVIQKNTAGSKEWTPTRNKWKVESGNEAIQTVGREMEGGYEICSFLVVSLIINIIFKISLCGSYEKNRSLLNYK